MSLLRGKSYELFDGSYEEIMKKTRIARPLGLVPAGKKPAMDHIYVDLLDKAMHPSNDKMKKAEKFRPVSVDVNHRFGKRSGST